MKGGFFAGLKSSKWTLVAGTLLLMGFAFLLNRWQNQIEAGKARAIREYHIDFDISRRKAEHLSKYQSFIGDFKMPKVRALQQNEWVQLAQSLAQEQSLSLRELKPVYSSGRKGSKTPDVFVVVEGKMSDLLRFLYLIAEVENAVYVEKLLISLAAEQTETVRAQMTLSQAKGQNGA